MSNKLRWVLGALLLSLGGLIGCGGDESGTTAAITGGSGGPTTTGGVTSTGGMTSAGGSGGAGASPSPRVGPSGWFAQTSGTSEWFTGVHFFDAMTG